MSLFHPGHFLVENIPDVLIFHAFSAKAVHILFPNVAQRQHNAIAVIFDESNELGQHCQHLDNPFPFLIRPVFLGVSFSLGGGNVAEPLHRDSTCLAGGIMAVVGIGEWDHKKSALVVYPKANIVMETAPMEAFLYSSETEEVGYTPIREGA